MLFDRTMSYPMRYGYCLVGQVESENTKFEIGKLVFSFSPHGTHALASANDIIALPDSVDPEDAVFAPSVETAVSMVYILLSSYHTYMHIHIKVFIEIILSLFFFHHKLCALLCRKIKMLCV